MLGALRKIASTTVQLAIGSVCAYATYDATNDAVMYYRGTRWLRRELERRDDVVAQLNGASGDDGTSIADVTIGPWYDASVVFTHHGMVVSLNVPMRGRAKSSDVLIRAVRKDGVASPLLYNLFGPGTWDIMCMDALVGMHSNRMLSVSLLDTPERPQLQHGPDGPDGSEVQSAQSAQSKQSAKSHVEAGTRRKVTHAFHRTHSRAPDDA